MNTTANDAFLTPPKVLEKFSTKPDNTSQKHSIPFYISPLLFRNKSLKRKRRRRSLIIARVTSQRQRKAHIAQLLPDITINLLSDDEDSNYRLHQAFQAQPQKPLKMPPLAYPFPVEISKIPNITLEPVPLNNDGCQKVTNGATPRKRKSRQPKRHTEPAATSDDCIVLSDDDCVDINGGMIITPVSSSAAAAIYHNGVMPKLVPIQRPHTPKKSTHLKTEIASTSNASSSPKELPVCSAQVDEEVTVSLVSRSSVAGRCGLPQAESTFPLLPDETTVHTVIANRIYELSLTKLREGLASCGHAELSDNQQKISPTRRGKGAVNPPPPSPPQAPVSLKLSSDLSISLISDDDEEEENERDIEQLLSPAKLLQQQQPQLLVQHIQVPAMPELDPTHPAPRRRKLG